MWFTLEVEEKGGLLWRQRKKVVYPGERGERGKRWFTLEIKEKGGREKTWFTLEKEEKRGLLWRQRKKVFNPRDMEKKKNQQSCYGRTSRDSFTRWIISKEQAKTLSLILSLTMQQKIVKTISACTESTSLILYRVNLKKIFIS